MANMSDITHGPVNLAEVEEAKERAALAEWFDGLPEEDARLFALVFPEDATSAWWNSPAAQEIIAATAANSLATDGTNWAVNRVRELVREFVVGDVKCLHWLAALAWERFVPYADAVVSGWSVFASVRADSDGEARRKRIVEVDRILMTMPMDPQNLFGGVPLTAPTGLIFPGIEFLFQSNSMAQVVLPPPPGAIDLGRPQGPSALVVTQSVWAREVPAELYRWYHEQDAARTPQSPNSPNIALA